MVIGVKSLVFVHLQRLQQLGLPLSVWMMKTLLRREGNNEHMKGQYMPGGRALGGGHVNRATNFGDW